MTALASEPPPSATAAPELPLQLRLAESDEPLVCETLLRNLPGVRWVCGGRWGGRPVVAKLFLDPQRRKRHWLRECRGARMLSERGIPSPALLRAQRLTSVDAYVTVFERVAGVSAAVVWNDVRNGPGRRDFLDSVIALLVQMHGVGLQQQDPHMDNLRLLEQTFVVLDAAAVKARRKPLAPRRGLDNLALQLVEFLGLGEDEVDALYQSYCRQRGYEPQRYRALFARLLQRQRRYHMRKNVGKAFRTCTAFITRRERGVRWGCDRELDSADLRSFLADPERYVQAAAAQLIKDGNSATVWRVPMAGNAVAVKRYNIKSTGHGLRRAVSRSRAARSWENGQCLRLLEVPSPRPVAFVEQRLGGFRRTAWLVTEWCDGRAAAEYFLGDAEAGEERARMARHLIAIIDRLGREGIVHGDLKATNFLIGPAGAVLIDLDAMRRPRGGRAWRRGRSRDLRRFRRNWPDPLWNSVFAKPFAELRL